MEGGGITFSIYFGKGGTQKGGASLRKKGVPTLEETMIGVEEQHTRSGTNVMV